MTKATIPNQQKDIKKALLYLTEEKKMKQSQIAKLTGRSPSVISEILKDDRAFAPGVLNIMAERLAKYTQKSDLIAEVSQYQVIYNTLVKAIKGEKRKRKTTAVFEHIIGGSGLGKTEVSKDFANEYKQFVYMVRLDRGMSYRELLEGIAYEMGLLKEEGKGSTRGIKRIQSSKLLDMITQKIETIVVDSSVGSYPVLIIDEAEEIPNATLRKVKNLYTAVEGMLSIVISGINRNKDRLYKLAGMKLDGSLRDQMVQNEYTTFVRRINFVTVPQISIEDLNIFCAHHGITSTKAIDIIYTTGLWWNYQIASDMVEHYGAEVFNKIKEERSFRTMCAQFM